MAEKETKTDLEKMGERQDGDYRTPILKEPDNTNQRRVDTR